jgi:hypothetical protein
MEHTTMETLIAYGLLAFVGLTVLRALLLTQPTQPQVIYVVAEPPAPQSGTGCLLPIIVGVVLIVMLRLLVGA